MSIELAPISLSSYSLSDEVKSPEQNAAIFYILSMGTEQSRKKMTQILNNVAKQLGHDSLMQCPWGQMRSQAILLLRSKWLQEGKAPSTINLMLSALKGVAQKAWEFRQLDDHEFNVIRSIKGARGSRVIKGRALNAIESSRLISGCENERTIKGIRDAAIFALGVGAGLRRNELATICRSKINFQDHSIRLIGKGNKERIVYLGDAVWLRLEQWLKVRSNNGVDEVFCTVLKGNHLDETRKMSVSAIFKVITDRASEFGVPELGVHDLRRTFATRLFAMGTDINIVKEAMGHASVSTTQRYDMRGVEAVAKATKQLGI